MDRIFGEIVKLTQFAHPTRSADLTLPILVLAFYRANLDMDDFLP